MRADDTPERVPQRAVIPPAPGGHLLLRVFLFAGLFFAVFYWGFLVHPESYLLSQFDWIKRLRFYADIRHQVFTLGQFPHYHSYYFKGTNVLFANAEEAVLTPLTLLLPCMSLCTFIRFHMAFHYLCTLAGIALLRRLWDLPRFSILLIFVVLGFNGRIVSNYYVGHAGFITVLWLPLLLYFYLSFMTRRDRPFMHACAVAIVMTMIFFEGGVHVINWIILFFILDACLFLGGVVLDRRTRAVRILAAPCLFWALVVAIFCGLSAVKLLPVAHVWGRMEFIGGGVGYRDIGFFFRTFYQRGLGSAIPFSEFWLQEAYNYIGSVACILAIPCLTYALCFGRDSLMRRLALLVVILLIFSLGTIYARIFEHVPVLKQEKAPTRFLFIALTLLSVVMPLALCRFMERVRVPLRAREAALFVAASAIFWQLLGESRKWMVPGAPQADLEMALSGPAALPADYAFCFYAGLTISIATAACLLAAALLLARRRGQAARRAAVVGGGAG